MLQAKGQIILKRFFLAEDSPKKRTKTRRILVKMNSFVCFLGESSAWQFAFEINWPLEGFRDNPTYPISNPDGHDREVYFFVGKRLTFYRLLKGQIISKSFFSGRGFFQKMNKYTSHTSKNEFIRSFFGRILGLTICFQN